MFTAQAGSGRALALRVALFSLAVAMAGCSAKPATGALEVEVVLEPGLISRCVKVTATDGTLSRESKPIPLDGKVSPLSVAVYADGLAQPVTVQALGYSDDACTILAAGEVSESKEANFTRPPSTVTLTLRPVVNGDGGFDGGLDGGTDGGVDAGLDLDLDGYPQPADCDDTNPAINPGATEACSNTFDDDCDGLSDCQQARCNNMTCAGAGTCMGNICVADTESVCNDGVDNNGDGLIDCADPQCPVDIDCSDFNSCTTGDRCVADGGCEKRGDVVCNMPPAAQCWEPAGMCLPDAGATCQYVQVGGGCNDGLACTSGDTCTSGSCDGTPVACPLPANTCLSPAGACQEPSGTCFHAPVPVGTGTCSDGQNCTTNDRCDGNGGCAGTPVMCPMPTQCQDPSTTCDADGGCILPPRTGLACDAGTAGTCDVNANCIANQTSLFPVPPSNFTEAQLPADAGTAFTVSCATILDTSGTPAITMGTCVTMPPFAIITQGGESTVLLKVTNLDVTTGQTLSIVGTRPVIFAVTGNVLVDGRIRARNGFGLTGCGNGGNGDGSGSGNGIGGGGGGAFGSDGGVGGTSGGGGAGTGGAANGSPTLVPLRGGCNGGNGTSAGGEGGGVIQISATGTITINDIITVPGRAGNGASASQGNSGGGGGSGGGILLEGVTVAVNATARLTANGGSGGEGSGTFAGTDGNDGLEGSSAATPNGGNNSPSGGNGGVGAGGSADAGAGGNVGNNDGAGGGGGGYGRIRINGWTSCTVAMTGPVVSPPASFSGTSCP